SNSTRILGSPAPALCSRDCKPIRLFPLPAPPLNSVMRPAGRPPRNTSSSPTMPVGTFWIAFLRSCCPAGSLCFALRVDVATAGPPLFILGFTLRQSPKALGEDDAFDVLHIQASHM